MATAPKKSAAAQAVSAAAPVEAAAAAINAVLPTAPQVAAPVEEIQQSFRSALAKSVVESRAALAKAKTSVLFNGPSEDLWEFCDDTVNFTREDDIRTRFAEIMKGQFDPAEMIARMTEVISADDGTYRNVWPPAIEDLIKQVQQDAWTRQA